MDNQQNKTATKPQLSPYQEGIKKALKQAGEQQTLEAMQHGVPPQHIEQQAGLQDPNQVLNQLLELSQTQVPARPQGETGLMSGGVGLIGALLNSVQGKGFNPMAPKMEQLGLNNAIQLQGAIQSGQKAPLEIQKLQGDVSQLPLQEEKLKTDVAKGKIDLRQSSPNYQVGMEVRKQAATEYATFAPKAIAIGSNLPELAETAKKLGEFETGLLAQMGGRTRAFSETFSKNPDFIKFDRIVNKILPALARMGGDTGVLTDTDIARWRPVLGDKTAPIASKIEAINEMMADLKIGIQERLDLAGVQPTPQIQKFVMEYQPIEISGAETLSSGNESIPKYDTDKEARYQAWKKSQGAK